MPIKDIIKNIGSDRDKLYRKIQEAINDARNTLTDDDISYILEMAINHKGIYSIIKKK